MTPDPSTSAPDRARDQVADAVRALLQAGALLGARARTEVGIGLTDLAALQALDALAGEPQPIGRLAAGLGLSSAAATELVDRLERAGFARRERDPRDRRRVLVALEPRARSVGADLLGPWQQRITAAVDDLAAGDARVVAAFLAALLADPG